MPQLFNIRTSSRQPPVLFLGQRQINATASHRNPMVNLLVLLQVVEAAAASDHFDQLGVVPESQASGERRLEVLFEELDLPTVAELKAHVDPVHRKSSVPQKRN
jgi:hypothetical protein